jgi:hypothetical protein
MIGQVLANVHAAAARVLPIVMARRNELTLLPVVQTSIELDGMWGKDSCKVAGNTPLADLQRMCVAAFLPPVTVLEPRDNQPHINIRGNSDVYRRIDRKSLVLRMEHVRISNNLLEIDTGFGTHFTLVFRRGIGADLQTRITLKSVWRSWAARTATNAAMLPVVEAQAQHSAASAAAAAPVLIAPSVVVVAVAGGNDSTDCCACMAAPIDCLIDCVHYCLCHACALQLDACPMCRVPITQRIQKRLVVG